MDLAKKTYVTTATISRIEREHFRPGHELLARLTHALGCGPHDFNVDPQPDPNPPVRLERRESELLENWRRLRPNLQERVTGMILALLIDTSEPIHRSDPEAVKFAKGLDADSDGADRENDKQAPSR